MVRDRETETGCRADGVLVAKPDWSVAVAGIFRTQTRFRVHFRLRIHVDTLYPQPNYPPATPGGTFGLP